MFSLVNGILGALDKIEHGVDFFKDKVPLAYFHGPPYWTPNGWRGKKNAWEYYFAPLSNYDIHDVLRMTHEEIENKRPNIIRDINGFFEKPWPLNENVLVTNKYYGPPQSFSYSYAAPEEMLRLRTYYAKLLHRWIKVTPELVERTEEYYRCHMKNSRVIGIHFRGCDKEIEILPHLKSRNLPQVVKTINQYIDLALQKHPDKIFVATDDADAYKSAVQRLGNKMISIDAIRNTGKLPVHWQNFGDTGALAGDQAVMDCLLLSKCDHIVHGLSNFVQTAFLFNDKVQGTYVYE
jgi:hypothetical protein